MANNQWEVYGMNLKMHLCFVDGPLVESANPFPRQYTCAHVKFRITFQRVSDSPPPKPSTETLVQSMSNKVRTGMYRLGSHIHSGYRMNFSWLPGSCPSWCPPSFLITISPFLWPIKLSVNQESRRFSVLFPLYGFRWLTCIEIL